MEKIVSEVITGGSFILLYLFIILLSKLVNNLLTPYDVDDELTQKDNVALATSMCGYLGATTIIFIGAMLGSSKGLLTDILVVGGYSLLGIILLNLSRIINDKLILYKFSNVKEIIEDRNEGTGAVQLGSYIASSMIIAGAIHGEGGGIITLLVFYALGQVALILFSAIHAFITPYDDHAEIEKDNVAAGVSLGGNLIAIGIVLMRGVAGNFISWEHNLMTFGITAALIILLLPIVRFLFNKIIIIGSDLNDEISQDKNNGAAFLEVIMAIGFATLLFFVMT